MDRENVAHIKWNLIQPLKNKRKEGNLAIRNNMEEPSEITQTQGEILHDLIRMRNLEELNSWKQRVEWWPPEAGG